MENIKRARALGGVSVQAIPAPTETKTTPVVPFMQLNERQNLKTVSFKDDIVKEVKDSIEINDMKPILEKFAQVMEKTQQVAEKQYRDNKRGRRRERRDSRDRRSRSYNRSSSCDRSKSRERSNSRDRNSRTRSRNQNSREKRKNSGTRYSLGLFCDHCKMITMISSIVTNYRRP